LGGFYGLSDVYVPDHNERFAVLPEDGMSGFVEIKDKALLRDILCVQSERVVGNDNTVRYKTMSLQLPQASHRYHFVKAKVRIHEYPDGQLGVFHGPRKLAQYTKNGQIIIEQGQIQKLAAVVSCWQT